MCWIDQRTCLHEVLAGVMRPLAEALSFPWSTTLYPCRSMNRRAAEIVEPDQLANAVSQSTHCGDEPGNALPKWWPIILHSLLACGAEAFESFEPVLDQNALFDGVQPLIT